MNVWLPSTCSWFIPFRPEIKIQRGKYGMIELCNSCDPIQSKRSRVSTYLFWVFFKPDPRDKDLSYKRFFEIQSISHLIGQISDPIPPSGNDFLSSVDRFKRMSLAVWSGGRGRCEALCVHISTRCGPSKIRAERVLRREGEGGGWGGWGGWGGGRVVCSSLSGELLCGLRFMIDRGKGWGGVGWEGGLRD